MLSAIVDGKRVDAQKGLSGKCPLCEREVFPKCGKQNVHHWSHKKNQSCQPSYWYEPETMWHFHWKKAFGGGHYEVVREKNGKKHFADIFTTEEVVIELQNSPILLPVIQIREEFYGKRMLWVINGTHFQERFDIATWIDNSPRSGRNWVRERMEKDGLLSDGFYNEGYKGNIGDKSKSKLYSFWWSNPRKCWGVSERPLFIDFKGDWLYQIRDWDKYNSGHVSRHSKQAFFDKYGGDYEYFKQNQEEAYAVSWGNDIITGTP